MVSIRVHGSILVPTRDKFAFIVCSQGRPEVRIPLWKQKVLDEESSQFENAEDEGCEAAGWVWDSECGTEAVGEEG